ncbi:MAG TPA: hypothetical protein VHB77_21245 [Planctomycetaceae bacterium]|nr:hypothetical protein [Planctomycetaceae bacterium]
MEFHLICGCGRVIDGERTSNYQQVVCPGCSQRLFVLPVSPYPRPKARKRDKPQPDETPQPRRNRKSRLRGRDKTKAKTETPAKPDRATKAKESRKDAKGGTDDRMAIRRRPPFFTPLRQVTLATACVLTATGLWLWHMQSLAAAQATLDSSAKLATAAWDAHDVPEAAKHYAAMRAAVDQLGRRDPEARRWRQWARETGAINHLCPQAPLQLVTEAIQARDAAGGLDWKEAFRITYQGSWMVIDTTATVPADVKEQQTRIELPMRVREEPVSLVVDFHAFERVLVDGNPQRVIFAAQLADCRPAGMKGPGWEIVLKSDTAFLWANPATFADLGFDLDESTQKVLNAQAKLLGIEP